MDRYRETEKWEREKEPVWILALPWFYENAHFSPFGISYLDI